MHGNHRWIGVGFAVVSATFVTTGVARAAEPLLDWSTVQNAVRAVEQGPQIGGGLVSIRAPLGLQAPGSVLPPLAVATPGSMASAGSQVGERPKRSAESGREATASMSPSLAGLSASVVPAVTGDLVLERRQIAVRSVSSSLGQVSGLRLYRPKVGAAIGVTSPDYVGVR